MYAIAFSLQALQGTMEYFLYSWNRATKKWFQLRMEEFRKKDKTQTSLYDYIVGGSCRTDCFRRISWIWQNICLGRGAGDRSSSRVVYDSKTYTNDILYMDDGDELEPDSFVNPLDVNADFRL